MKKYIVSMFLVIGALHLEAQDKNPIQDTVLQNLIQQAVNNFPRIKELQEQLRVNDVKDELIRSNYQPTLGADASYRFQAPVPQIAVNGGDKFKFQPYNLINGGLTLNQLIYDFGKTKAQLERNRKEQAYTQDNVDNNKNAVAYQVAQVYYSIVFTGKAIAVQQEQVRTLKENERIIESKIKNGDAIEYDLLNTRVRTSNADNTLKELEGMQQRNYILMKWLTGTQIEDVAKRDDLDESIPLVTTAGNWKATNAQAQLIQRQMELLELDRKLTTINNKPNLFASANGGFRNGFPPNVEQVKLAGSAGVGIAIPIISASRPKLQQQLVDVNLETSRKSLLTLESEVNKDLANINQHYQTNTQKLENSKITVEQANKAYKLAQTRYKEGLITNTELILVQIGVEEANLNLLQYRYQLLLDRLESHKVIGTRIY